VGGEAQDILTAKEVGGFGSPSPIHDTSALVLMLKKTLFSTAQSRACCGRRAGAGCVRAHLFFASVGAYLDQRVSAHQLLARLTLVRVVPHIQLQFDQQSAKSRPATWSEPSTSGSSASWCVMRTPKRAARRSTRSCSSSCRAVCATQQGAVVGRCVRSIDNLAPGAHTLASRFRIEIERFAAGVSLRLARRKERKAHGRETVR
jgi:hypothetical protein